MLRFRTALLDFLRRWGIYGAIVVVLFGAGSNAPLTIAAALAAVFLWPLRFAAAHGLLLVPATVGYAVVGTLPVMLTRPLWWPRGWAAAERALPLAPDVVRRSDRLFALLTMLPWQTVLLIGGIGTWLNDQAGGAVAERWWAFGGWAVSAFGSLQLSLLWMRVVRRGAITTRPTTRIPRRERSRRRRTVRRLGVRRALIVAPMLRATAPRSVLALLFGTIAAAASAILPMWAGLSIAWSFTFEALALLGATSVLRTSTIRELRPLWQDARHLPLQPRTCERARLLVTLLPLVAGGLACCAIGIVSTAPLRPQVCALYGAVVIVGCVVEALTSKAMSPSDHSARWLLTLVAALAFASEISP